MTSHLANISPYRRRARERIALEHGVILSPNDDGRTACDPLHASVPEPSPPRERSEPIDQLPSIWEALSIAIVGGLLVILILRGILGHF